MALDKFFLTVFIMEILIKWYHDFFGFWKVNWNIFDFIIVAASLLGPSKWRHSSNHGKSPLVITYYTSLDNSQACLYQM